MKIKTGQIYMDECENIFIVPGHNWCGNLFYNVECSFYKSTIWIFNEREINSWHYIGVL